MDALQNMMAAALIEKMQQAKDTPDPDAKTAPLVEYVRCDDCGGNGRYRSHPMICSHCCGAGVVPKPLPSERGE